MRNTILALLQGGMVKRFHTRPTLQVDTVAQHSFFVAWFCALVAPPGINLANLLLHALRHDMGEFVTGDMPAHTKRAAGIQDLLHDLENTVTDNFYPLVPLGAEEAKILKLADCFSGMLFCIQERMMGNAAILDIFQRWVGYCQDWSDLRFELRESNSNLSKIYHALRSLWLQAPRGDLYVSE